MFVVFGFYFLSIPEPFVSVDFKGPGAFPSSRLASHKKFELGGMVYVDFDVSWTISLPFGIFPILPGGGPLYVSLRCHTKRLPADPTARGDDFFFAAP